MKIRPVGTDLFHADGQAGMKKLIFAFRNLTKAPINLTRVISGHFTVGRIRNFSHHRSPNFLYPITKQVCHLYESH